MTRYLVDPATGAVIAERAAVRVHAADPARAAADAAAGAGMPLPEHAVGLDREDVLDSIDRRGLADGFGPGGPNGGQLDRIWDLVVSSEGPGNALAEAVAAAVDWVLVEDAAAAARAGGARHVSLDPAELLLDMQERGLLDSFGPAGPTAGQLDRVGERMLDDDQLWDGYYEALRTAVDAVAGEDPPPPGPAPERGAER